LKVYVSSTYRDLKDYREKVREALLQLGYEGVAMEYYVAESRRPVEKCLEDVASCDIYIGVFAWRYGWIPEEHNPERLSITHLEYNQAVATGKPCFIFVLDGDHPWPKSSMDPDDSRITALRNTASERNGGLPFTNTDHLASQVKSALFSWAKKHGYFAPPPPSTTFDKARYFGEMARRYQRLDLEGLTPPEKEEYLQITLASVFVEPGVRDDPPPLFLTRELRERIQQDAEIDPDDFPEELPLEEVQRTSDVYYRKPPRKVVDVLTDEHNPLVVLLGDPGSGKSTLTRYIILSLIDPAGDARLHAACPDHLPVLVELRSYVALRRQHPDWKGFPEYLAHLGATEGFFPDRDTLERYLSEGHGALVIFDGLDEIFDPEERLQVSRQILFFAKTYPRARVIVTSRIIGYSRKVLDEGGFRHFTLQDLDEPQVEQFVTQWYEIALAGKPDDAKMRRERIMEAYQHSPSVKQLAGNPMLLTIMAIIGKHQDLPRDRGELYAHAATVLIEHWDVNKYLSQHQGGGTGIYLDEEPSPYAAIDSEDKREMLRRLAFRMQGGKGGLAGNYIHHDQLQSEFASYLKERYDWQPHVAKTVARKMLLQFRERNFILSLYGANLYGFVHRAFLEYFCATAFRNQFERTQSLSFDALKREVFGVHWQDRSWHEVLRLISGMLAPEFTAGLIQYLVEEVEAAPALQPGDDTKPWNLALAVQCLSEARNLKQLAAPAERLLRRICALFDADMRRPPRLFAFVRDQIVPYAQSMGPSWPRSEVLAAILRERTPQRYSYIYDQ
jgi:GTPase SAR1 family protein